MWQKCQNSLDFLFSKPLTDWSLGLVYECEVSYELIRSRKMGKDFAQGDKTPDYSSEKIHAT